LKADLKVFILRRTSRLKDLIGGLRKKDEFHCSEYQLLGAAPRIESARRL
jgi:hypothetical protein